MRKRLQINPIGGEIFRFHVASQRADVDPYLVDLSALDGNGVCDCEHFRHRLYEEAKAQLKLPWQKRNQINCIHLLDCRDYFTQEIIHGLMAKMAEAAMVKRQFGFREIEQPTNETKD